MNTSATDIYGDEEDAANEDTSLNDIETPAVEEDISGGYPQPQTYNPSATLDPRWVDAIIGQESGGNPRAVSSANAQGLMQIIPSTFKAYSDPGDNPFDAEDSIKVGTRYFSHLYNRYNDVDLALAAYNAGEGAVDKYRRKTKYGTFEEVSQAMKADNAYAETRNYVPAIQKRYQKIISAEELGAPSNYVGSSEGSFKEDLANLIGDPSFNGLSTHEKIKAFNTTYHSKERDSQDLQDLKTASGIVWEGASPEEAPDFKNIFTPPPVTPKGEDLDKTLSNWKTENIQSMYDKGLMPELFGSAVDTYLDSQADDERKAYETRNRGFFSWALNRTGNYVREGLKGIAKQVTGAEAGVVRLAGGDTEYANRIEEMPEVWLGQPSRDFLYQTDENGYLVTNPDGTPQSTWQSEIAQGVGGIAGMIGGIGIAGAAGVSQKVITAFDLGVNSLNMANGTFRTVYEKTGDPTKAYASAFLSLPAAAIGTISQLSIASGKFRPVLAGMDRFNQAKFLAKSTINNVAVGAMTGAAIDTSLQLNEKAFTGQDFSKERLAISTISGGIGAGAAGAVGDYLGARSNYLKNEAINKTKVTEATKSLQDFQYDIAPETIIDSQAKHIPTDVAKQMGITVLGEDANGGTRVSKTSTVAPEAEIPGIVNAIGNLPTPDDIEIYHKEYGALKNIPEENRSAKQQARFDELSGLLFNNKDPLVDWRSDNYVSNIKAYENALHQRLSEEPGALPIKWIPEEKNWEHVQTGERSKFARDLLFPKASEVREYAQDLSDISKLQIIREKEFEDNLTRLEALRKDEKLSKKELKSIDKEINTQRKLVGRFQKGIGSYNPKEGRITLSNDASDHVLAHEVAHAVSEKLDLPENVNRVLDQKIKDLKDKSQILKAKDLANEVILPGAQPQISDVLEIKDLTPKSRKALFDKEELLANQLGAIILKQEGKDIGNYKIIPELEDYVTDNVKLPRLFKQKTQDIGVEAVQNTAAKEGQVLEEGPPPNVPPSSGGKGGPEQPKGPKINIFTGEEYETAASKTQRELVPTKPESTNQKTSKKLGERNARKYVSDKKTSELIGEIERGEWDHDTREREVFLTALVEKVDNEFTANPTSKEVADNYIKINNLWETSRSEAGQVLALGMRFRNAESFPEYLLSLKRAMREAGIENTDLSSETLFALRELWGKAQKLEGKLRDDQLWKGWHETLKDKGTNFGKWFKNYRKLGMLSGLGTFGVNWVGGTWMGPFVTALSHPFYGRGMVWKTMWQTIPEAKASFKRVWESKSGDQFQAALRDSTPIDYQSKNPLVSVLDRFGRNVGKILASTDEFNRTLAGAIDLNIEAYKALKKQYPDDAGKFTAEASKLLIKPEDREAAIKQAYFEAQKAGVKITPSDATVRAYEILRSNVPQELIESAHDWAEATSLKGPLARGYLAWLSNTFFGTALWKNNPTLATAFDFIAPFGRAAIRLADFSLDFVPGSYLATKTGEKVFGIDFTRPNSALQRRYERGQVIGNILGASLFGLVQTGAIKITGDPEKILDRDQKDVKTGQKARSRAEFKEYEQTGEEPFSVVIPGLGSFVYKDIPGLNGILYGIYKAQNASKEGKALPYVVGDFSYNALKASLPFIGINSLSSPYTRFIDKIASDEATLEGVKEGLVEVLTQTAKSAVPAVGLLRDIKRVYDESPPESNQAKVQKFFSDIPGAAEIFGSKPALNVFGEPAKKDVFDRIPAVGRFYAPERKEQDPVIEALINKGIAVPDVAKTIKFGKNDFPSETFQQKYTATREERLDKAYSSAFSPDEWYAFIQATGPHIKQVAAQIASSDLPTDKAQKLLVKRVEEIREVAKKRYIRTGHF